MWARRCGAAPGWPSRVKVIFFSFFSGTLGLSVYMYMAGSNVSYLDLESPNAAQVLCLKSWPMRKHAISWSAPADSIHTFFDPGGPEAWHLARESTCSPESLLYKQCSNIVIPVGQLKRPLALAMNVDETESFDVLGLWARFFLLLTFFIWLGVTTHDLALIGQRKKHFILDVSGMNAHCPSIRKVWMALAGYGGLKRLVFQEKIGLRMLGIGISIVLAPILLAWNLVLFNFFIVPLLLLAFVRYPIRMSRVWVFISCCACCLYGGGLAVQQVAFVADPILRPRYAITWIPDVPLEYTPAGGDPVLIDCTCGCDYPVSFSVCVNLLIIGVLTTIKSVFLAFRCLKGLRRSQWANLLSVMFPVPITLYTVDWRLPTGMPIRFRTEGVPVQGEIAFDPFAMMDEQLDSAGTTINLKPEPVHRYEYNQVSGELRLVDPGRHLEMPSVPMPAFREQDLQVKKVEYIGCCGFPWPTGGQQCVYDPEFMAQLEEGLELLEGSGCETAGATATGDSQAKVLGISGADGDKTADDNDDMGDEVLEVSGLSLPPRRQTPSLDPSDVMVAIDEQEGLLGGCCPHPPASSGTGATPAATPRRPSEHSAPNCGDDPNVSPFSDGSTKSTNSSLLRL
mmetsp:Transcript_96326/g.276566  ORF Transcript_96326/g.276566 Transcript_96326/m.276566 type:complete len:624 (-) Transcript_96326:86-1957(-)